MVKKQKDQLSLRISKGLRALHRLPVIPWVSVVVAVFFVFHIVAPVRAADGIRKTINFQGKLVNQNGLNVADGNYTVVFTLYDDPNTGTNVWDETQSVTTTDGIFQVELGTVDTTLGNVNFNSDQLYLGIKVGTDAEMTPRIRFTAVPYAFNAQKVNGLTVTNTSGNPFATATTLRIADGKTVTISNGLTLEGTDATTITFQGTDTYVGRTTTDTLTNKTIGSTGLTFSGASIDLTTVSNEDLTFSTNGTGDLVLNSDFDSGVSIGSASNTPATLSISGGIGENAALIVNQTNAGDLFVASAAGTTRFRLANNGDVMLSGGINLGSSVGTSTQCLRGGATASWGTCSSGGGNGEDLIQGKGTLTDTILAATSTLLGTVSVTPTTASGDIWVQAQLWTRSLSATDQTLTFEIRAGANCSGTLLDSETSLLTSASGSNGPAGFVSYIETNPGTSAKTYAVCALTTTANGSRAGGLATATVIDTNAAAPGANTNYLRLENGAFSLVNDTADYLFGSNASISAAFKLSRNGTSPTASIAGATANAALVADNTGFGDLFTASKSGATKFTVLNSGDLRLANYTTAGGFLYTNSTGTVLQTAAGNTGECLKSAGGSTPTWGTCGGGGINYWELQSGLLYNGNLTTDFAVGGLSSTSAKFKVSQSGTQPTASVAGTTANASLVVDNTGFGDLLTASKSGATKFTVLNSGDVRINNLLSCDVKTDASGLLLCGTDATGPGGSGTNYLFLNNGTFSFINNTADVLIGGDSTSSAKFAFMNLNNNSGLDPLASFSGTMRIGAKPNSSATQQTTWTKVSQTTPGQIASGGTQNIASISAMVTYNGSVYVGTYGTNVGTAEIYRYSGTNSTWTKVSQATPGQIASGGTQNVASVSAMTVYDGRLYAGTSKMNEAEIYRYDGGTTWTKVSGAAGTFGTVTAQDGVASLGVYNGSLFVGTREGNAANAPGTGARLLRWNGGTWTPINTTAGQFVTTTSVGVHAVSNIVTFNNTLFLGLSKAGDSDVVRYTGGAGASVFLSMNTANLTGGFNINGTATAAYAADEITSMIVYNNTLIIGTRKNNAADVLMLNYSPIATAADQPWTRLNQAAGQLSNGGTASIDQIASMLVYNGMLYLGTREGNSAEIYRYTGGDERFHKVSQTTAGTIASGGTSSIDGVVKLLASNGDLYAGTMELGRAEIYKHTSSIDRSYGLEFVANPQIAGGTQNSQINHASIFYLASASANLSSNNANTGAFIFSHGIQTRNGSYDVAEDYPTRDETLEAGDVVSIDTAERGFVIKSEKAYDSAVIGVYSSDPALRLSQADARIDGARAVPIALAGRVAVNVSTENGEINPGDYLTSSSRPGVAMKATRAGVVIGQAMGGFSCEAEETVCSGQVLTYIKSASYLGSVASAFAGFELKEKPSGQDLLAAIKTQAYSEAAAESSIVTDQLVAGLRVVAPEVTADKVRITTIEAVNNKNIDITLSDEGVLAVKNASGEAGMIFTGAGDAYFGGHVQAETLAADTLVVNQIQMSSEGWKAAFAEGGLESIQERIMNQESRIAELENKLASASATSVEKQASFPASLLAEVTAGAYERTLGDDITQASKLVVDSVRVTGSAIIEGIVHVVDTLTVQDLIVDNLATFLGNVVFSGDVFFAGHPTFNTDTAGLAVVKKGTDRVEVKFEKAYKAAPMVNVNLTLDEVSPMPGEALENLVRRQEALEDRLLDSNVRYIVTKRTAKGFVILLDRVADEDIAFSWIVVAVDSPLVHHADVDNPRTLKGHIDENTQPISSNIPTIIPTSSIEKREVEILPSPKELLDGEEVSRE